VTEVEHFMINNMLGSITILMVKQRQSKDSVDRERLSRQHYILHITAIVDLTYSEATALILLHGYKNFRGVGVKSSETAKLVL